jgi:hypothetical protein
LYYSTDFKGSFKIAQLLRLFVTLRYGDENNRSSPNRFGSIGSSTDGVNHPIDLTSKTGFSKLKFCSTG